MNTLTSVEREGDRGGVERMKERTKGKCDEE